MPRCVDYTGAMTMNAEDRKFLKDFFNKVTDRALDPAKDEEYVAIYDRPELSDRDPVELMARAIEWTPGQSVQLLSGFRGIGKSTELRRLRQRLRQAGYVVVVTDIEDYLSTSEPVEISEFQLAICAAFAQKLHEEEEIGKDPARKGYLQRFVSFLRETEIDLQEFSMGGDAGLVSVELQGALKRNPTFKDKLRKTLALRDNFQKQVETFISNTVAEVKKNHKDSTDVVLIVDSLDHFRGVSTTAEEVHASLERLFASHADRLHFRNLHLIYTIPPYLNVLYPNLGSLYTPGGMKMLTTVKVRDRDTQEPYKPGLETLRQVVSQRGTWERLLSAEALNRVILASGGHLRDLLRILAEVMRLATALPVGDNTVETAIAEIRSQFLPIADDNAIWLEKVHITHDASLPSGHKTHDLSVFFDTHMILCYRNGEAWYDVHPLVRDHILRQAGRLKKTERDQAKGSPPHGDLDSSED